jgi:hypothetical protein
MAVAIWVDHRLWKSSRNGLQLRRALSGGTNGQILDVSRSDRTITGLGHIVDEPSKIGSRRSVRFRSDRCAGDVLWTVARLRWPARSQVTVAASSPPAAPQRGSLSSSNLADGALHHQVGGLCHANRSPEGWFAG